MLINSLILICHCLLTCPIFNLLPSVFFILKAHRDFSLNVICAIQAWFIIINKRFISYKFQRLKKPADAMGHYQKGGRTSVPGNIEVTSINFLSICSSYILILIHWKSYKQISYFQELLYINITVLIISHVSEICPENFNNPLL